MINQAVIGEYKEIDGKIPETNPDRRAKRMKIWDLWSYALCYVGYFSCVII